MSHEIPIAPGDSVICNMTRLGDDEWFIGSKISSTGKETNQKASAATLETQPWVSARAQYMPVFGAPDDMFFTNVHANRN